MGVQADINKRKPNLTNRPTPPPQNQQLYPNKKGTHRYFRIAPTCLHHIRVNPQICRAIHLHAVTIIRYAQAPVAIITPGPCGPQCQRMRTTHAETESHRYECDTVARRSSAKLLIYMTQAVVLMASELARHVQHVAQN